jgi:FkbM family methyltransferase
MTALALSMWRAVSRHNFAMRFLRKYFYYLYSIVELLTGFENPALIFHIFTKNNTATHPTIQLRQSGLSFRVRGAMDVWSIKETFLDRFYERYGFTIQPGWTVIDVGAGLGDFTLFAAGVSGTRVLAFEPFPESFGLLTENMALNQMDNVVVFPEAVGSAEGSLLLDLAGGEPLQFQSRAAPVTRPESQISVKARPLQEIIDRPDIENCDLLKLDCEGAEYDILMKSAPEALAKIRRIVMEYHDHVTEYSHKDLADFLLKQGYKVQVFINPVHENLGYLRAER